MLSISKILLSIFIAIWQLEFHTVSADKIIKSNALLSCMDNSQFSASTFDVVYRPGNNSVAISVSAISAISGNVTADVQVIAYGIKILSRKVNACDLNIGSLCPISPGHIDLSTTLKVTSEISKNIPGIAYGIPDLDGVVQVQVYQAGSSSPIACVEATLSNGKTVQTKYASWGIGAVCLIGILCAGAAAMAGSLSTSAHIASNVVSLFVYFQGVAIISMMAVERLPPIAAAWAQNFQWTMGLMKVRFMQKIFKWYVQSTGGTSINILPYKDTLSVEVEKRDASGLLPSAPSFFASKHAEDHFQRNLYRRAFEMPQLFARAVSNSSSQITTSNEADANLRSKTLILRGMQRVAYLAEIEYSNLFITGVVFFVVLCVLSFLFMGLVKGIVELLVKIRAIQSSRFVDYRQNWREWVKGFFFRLVLIAFPQLTVLCLWELTRNDSPACIVIAIFTYIVALGMLGLASYRVITAAKKSTQLYKNPAYILYSDNHFLNKWGFLYVQFRATAYWFALVVLAYTFSRSCFIAFGQAQGKAQAMGIFIVELAYFITICWLKPFMDKSTNGFNIATAVISVLNSIMFLLFSEIFKNPQSVGGIAAIVFFVVNAVFSLVLLIMIIVSCVWFIFSKNPDTRYQPMRDDRESFMKDPNGNEKVEAGTELDALGVSARGDDRYAEGIRRSMMQADDEDAPPPSARATNFLHPQGVYRNLSEADTENRRQTHLGSTGSADSLSYHGEGGSSGTLGYTRPYNPFENESTETMFEAPSHTPYRRESPTVFPPAAATSYRGYYPGNES